jgi:hypothetical protein
MPSIPVDVLLVILEHVDRADLASICRLNKICCSCSQDVLYRHLHLGIEITRHQQIELYQTLAQSTHLAKRVRSIDIILLNSRIFRNVAKALRNMPSLRILKFDGSSYSNILDGCTFKLHSFSSIRSRGNHESFQNFIRNQTSLTDITIVGYDTSRPIEAICLPNLTRVTTKSLRWVSRIVPGRSVGEVNIIGSSFGNSADLSFFTLSIAPVQKLTIRDSYLYPKSGELLASIFPSLTNLTMLTSYKDVFVSQRVRVSFYLFIIDLLCRRLYLTLTNGLKTCLLP